MSSLRHTPLHDVHAQLGASFTDFGGWDMPLKYGSELAEHKAVRATAGIFDLSHMGEIRITGAAAPDFLDEALLVLYSTMKVGKAKYGLIVNETGGIIDDLITYRLADDEFLIVPNASNAQAVVAALSTRLADFRTRQPAAEVNLADESADTALIAVQGPAAEAIVSDWVRATGAGDELVKQIHELGYYAAMPLTVQGVTLLLARTGYTGEDGFELYLPNAAAATTWQELSTAGKAHALVPCGLAARDSLRLEAGMPLYGHELSLHTTPFDAGLGRMIPFAKKGEFFARQALEQLKDTPVSRKLVGLRSAGRRAGRAGAPILKDGTVVGEITSGQPSPTLGYPIALAYVDVADAAPGTELVVDIRGKEHDFVITELPFYRRK